MAQIARLGIGEPYTYNSIHPVYRQHFPCEQKTCTKLSRYVRSNLMRGTCMRALTPHILLKLALAGESGRVRLPRLTRSKQVHVRPNNKMSVQHLHGHTLAQAPPFAHASKGSFTLGSKHEHVRPTNKKSVQHVHGHALAQPPPFAHASKGSFTLTCANHHQDTATRPE